MTGPLLIGESGPLEIEGISWDMNIDICTITAKDMVCIDRLPSLEARLPRLRQLLRYMRTYDLNKTFDVVEISRSASISTFSAFAALVESSLEQPPGHVWFTIEARPWSRWIDVDVSWTASRITFRESRQGGARGGSPVYDLSFERAEANHPGIMAALMTAEALCLSGTDTVERAKASMGVTTGAPTPPIDLPSDIGTYSFVNSAVK
jgi:hypothetical protein